MEYSRTEVPKDDGEAAEANRKDREARSIAIEKVDYTNQNLNLYCKKFFCNKASITYNFTHLLLIQAYVHDVYEQISSHISVDTRYRGAWPRVKQFVQELEPGSIVCDVGCGNGKYLNINPDIFVVGSDRCMSLTQTAREKDLEVIAKFY